LTIRNVIPLIGPFIIAAKQLGWDIKQSYSFFGFERNEQHINFNDSGQTVKYLNEEFPTIVEEISPSSKMSIFKEACKNIDQTNIIASVAPCAGLSLLNSCSSEVSQKGRGANAKQNDWIYGAVKFYLATDSDVFVLENAPALASHIGKPIIDNIIRICEENGYNRKIQLVRTTTINHGLPQNRRRSFLFIHKNKNFIKLTNKKHVSISIENYLKSIKKTDDDFSIADNLEYSRIWMKFLIEHPWILNDVAESKKDVKEASLSIWPHIIDKIYPAHPEIFDNFPQLKNEYEAKRKKLDSGHGYWDGSPVYLKGKINAIISKNAFRFLNPLDTTKYLTFNEMKALMGFPADFKLVNPIKNFNHICQNVPIPTAKDALLWGEEILSNDNPIEVNTKFLIQSNLKSDLEHTLLNDKFKPISSQYDEMLLFGATS